LQEVFEAAEVGKRLRVLDAQRAPFQRTAEDDEGFPAAGGAREVEAVDPHAGSFVATLPTFAVLPRFPVEAVDVWLAVVFRELLPLVLATRDVPFDHLVHLGSY
jgi:hypothetical protein